MSDPIDKALDEYLSGNSQVSRRYRELDDAAVPPQLDRAVLAQARAAVADRQPSPTSGQAGEHTDELERLRQRRKRLMQWSLPAGLAASAVLVVSIVMQSGVQHEVVSLPQQPASTPAVVQESADRSSDKEGVVVLTQPQAQPPALMTAPAEVPADASLGQAEMEKIESNAKRSRKEQGAPPSAALQIPEGIQRSVSSRAIDGTASEPAVAKQQASQSQDSNSHAAAEATAARNQQIQLEAPEHWLERIRQLRKDGKAKDADREWQGFREAYPDYAVAETDTARARP